MPQTCRHCQLVYELKTYGNTIKEDEYCPGCGMKVGTRPTNTS